MSISFFGFFHIQIFSHTCFHVVLFQPLFHFLKEACKAIYSTPVEIETKEEGEFIATHIHGKEKQIIISPVQIHAHRNRNAMSVMDFSYSKSGFLPL